MQSMLEPSDRQNFLFYATDPQSVISWEIPERLFLVTRFKSCTLPWWTLGTVYAALALENMINPSGDSSTGNPSYQIFPGSLKRGAANLTLQLSANIHSHSQPCCLIQVFSDESKNAV